MRKTLPQANNLDKVVDVLKFIYYNPQCSYQEIADYIGFSKRQAQYYTEAGIYLNLINSNRTPTVVCEKIFRENLVNITASVYEKIMVDELMGQVLAKLLIFPDCDIENYARELVSMYYPEISSEATFIRRAHVIVLWSKRIRNYLLNQQKK